MGLHQYPGVIGFQPEIEQLVDELAGQSLEGPPQVQLDQVVRRQTLLVLPYWLWPTYEFARLLLVSCRGHGSDKT